MNKYIKLQYGLRLFLIGLISLLLRALPVSGQEIGYYNFEDFTLAHKQGVPAVYSMFQDTTGVLWFGSTNGIYRYDGSKIYEFEKPWKTLLGKTNYSFLQAANGDVIIGSDYSICRFDIRKNTVHLIVHLNRVFNDRSCYYPLCFDKKGQLWFVVSGKGIGCYNGKTVQWKQLPNPICPGQVGKINDAYYDPSTDNVYISNFTNYKTAVFNLNSYTIELDSTHLTYSFKRIGNKLYRIFSNEVLSVDLSDGTRERFKPAIRQETPITPLYSKSVIVDNSWIWISFLDGILPFNYKQRTFGKAFGYEGDTKSNRIKHISALFRDREGNIWVCTETNGIKTLNLSQVVRFQHLMDFESSGNIVMDIVTVNDSLLLVSPLMSPPQLVNIYTNKHIPLLVPESAQKGTCNETRINATTILVSRQDGALFSFDTRKLELRKLLSPFGGIQRVFVLPITGEIIVYNGAKLFKCRFAKGKLKILKSTTPEFFSENVLFNPFTQHIYFGNQEKCIEIDAVNLRESRKLLPFFGSFIDYAWDRKKNLWLATRSGLMHYDSHFRLTEVFNTTNGLNNDVIYSIHPNADTSYFYLSTNLGISSFSLSDKKIMNYGLSDGLLESEHNGSASAADLKGNYYFGNINGITVFKESIREPLSIIPFLIIQGINAHDTNAKEYTNPNFLDRIELFPEDDALDLKFSLLSTSSPAKLFYSYKIEGIDKDFYHTSSAVAVRISKPSPGTYTLILRGATGTGPFVEKRIKLIVHAPFYLKWWFIIPLVLVFHFFVYMAIKQIIRNRVQKKQKEIEKERLLFEQKSQIARELHDNVGARLSMMLNTMDWIGKKPRVEQQDISEIRENTRDVIQGLRDAIWVMDKTQVSTEELFDKIKYYSNQFVRKSDVRLLFNEVVHIPFSLTTAEALNIFRIVQESLNNAIKYADTELFEISLDYIGDTGILLKVIDHGAGFDPAIVFHGHGINNMRSRAKEINASLNIMSLPGKGTTIEIGLNKG